MPNNFDLFQGDHHVLGPMAQLSNPNTFPEPAQRGVGQVGDYVSAMIRNGTDPKEIEEFMRQYQFGNTMPGVSPQQSLWENFLSKGNIALEDIKNIGTKLGGISAGAVIPPFLDDIMQEGMNQRNQAKGGA